ncbi:MAG: putative methylase [Actinomycetota bacterium]|nr:putative methylase [Actinomycetota bacterium]
MEGLLRAGWGAGVTYKRKLIEVALPLEAINRESAREKSIRHGHPSTLHLWWARRPLAACRAIVFASLVDDPSSLPEQFPTAEAQDAERQRLFRIIEDLVRWENTTNESVLDAARAEILRSCGGHPPPIYDPFCGGGSIPLEAQRLGLEAHGSDLNPVAVLITKALIEIPPKFAGNPPIHPDGGRLATGTWKGAQGLAEDVRYYGKWMSDEAERRIGHLYPAIEGRTVIAWIWGRTITCPNPACGTTMPLLNSFALSRRIGREAWLEPISDRRRRVVDFKVRSGPGCPTAGSVGRSGALCIACGTAIPLSAVRMEAKAGRMGVQLLCTIGEGNRRRVYFDADEEQLRAAQVERPQGIPETELPHNPRAFTTPNYGITRHWQLFTDRQLVAMTVFCGLVGEARTRILNDGGSEDYADAVATYLGLGIGRLANRCSSQCFWDAGGEGVMQVFARNALPMVWVYAEANPFSESSGNFTGQIGYLVEALARTPAYGQAVVQQVDAAALIERPGVAVATDPPYYDNVPYADLSDFFYIWLRRCLARIYPELFSTLLVPKAQELIAEPSRQGSWPAAAAFFEAGLRSAFENLLAVQDESFPLTVFYAFKQSEDTDDGAGRVSTGWETMLQGLLDAGASITGTWPVRTEQPGGLREVGRAALASSIVLVCRKRLTTAPLATRKEFVGALRSELPIALHQLQAGNIAPVDLAQASIGPGMAVYSQYARVIEADGSIMKVRAALGIINQVLDEILSEQDGDFDADTRWALAWFDEAGMESGSFGKAETLSKAKNTAVNGLVQAGIIEQRGNKVRLFARAELDESWNPTLDTRLTVWEVAQHLILALETGGESEAADLLRQVGELGQTAKELAYRLYVICEHKKWTKEALAYNALVVAWPEISRLAAGESTFRTVQKGML